MNIVCLIGRLTRDPELRYTTGEKPTAVCNFTLAVDRMNEGADFIRCIAFGKTAEVIGKHMTKGRQGAVKGRIQTGSYEDRNGQNHSTTDVIAERFYFVGSKNEKPQEEKPQEQMAIPEGFETIDESDVPF